MRILALTAAILLAGAASASADGGCQGWTAQSTVASADSGQGSGSQSTYIVKKGQAQAGS